MVPNDCLKTCIGKWNQVSKFALLKLIKEHIFSIFMKNIEKTETINLSNREENKWLAVIMKLCNKHDTSAKRGA